MRTTDRKTKLLTAAGALAVLALVAHFLGKPLMAQVRAVLVQNIDEPARNPFSVSAIGNGGGFTLPSATFSVPATSRYIIQQYAVQCNVSSGAPLAALTLTATSRNVAQSAFTPGFPLFVPGGSAASGNTHLYADPGTPINLVADVPFVTSTGCTFYVSGYSVNLP